MGRNRLNIHWNYLVFSKPFIVITLSISVWIKNIINSHSWLFYWNNFLFCPISFYIVQFFIFSSWFYTGNIIFFNINIKLWIQIRGQISIISIKKGFYFIAVKLLKDMLFTYLWFAGFLPCKITNIWLIHIFGFFTSWKSIKLHYRWFNIRTIYID